MIISFNVSIRNCRGIVRVSVGLVDFVDQLG